MKEKYSQVKKVLVLILFANLFVAVMKIIVGNLIKSTSMTADGFHSLTDGTSNIVGLIGIYIAYKPVDEDHPYGHKKFETLAGLFIAGMLIFLAGNVFFNAISRIFDPVIPQVSIASLVALLVTLGINIFVSRYELARGKELQSDVLISDSMHTRSDIYVSIGVLVTLIGIKLGLPPIIDPIASLVVAGFISHAAYDIIKHTFAVLTDQVVVDAEKILEIVSHFADVKDVHNIRSRGREDDLHIDFHVMTEPGMSVEKAHQLVHDLEEKVKEEINPHAQVLVHLEPYKDSTN